MTDQKYRVPPSSKQSEMLVLGSMLNSVNSLNCGADNLDDSDFYYKEHKTIFAVLKSLYMQDKPADLHLVAEELKRQDKLQGVGGVSSLVSLSQCAGTSAYVEEYATIVKKKSTLRKMISACQIIEKDAVSDPENVDDSLDEAQSLFYQIGQASGKDNGAILSQILSGEKSESKENFMKIIEDRQHKFHENGLKNTITGISSGFIDLDKMINGLNNTNLIILAARPAMGKTALAVNIAEHVCFNLDMPVGIFSLEMSGEQLSHRILSSQSQVESDKITNGNIDGDEFQNLFATVERLKDKKMIIEDQGGLKITEIRSRARRMKEAYDIKLLVIDYLQLLSGSGNFKGQENRQQEVSEISRMLKNLAKELNIPILCLSQLSRKVEDREVKRPLMSDLRDSGSIEQDADIVMFLYREAYYDKENKAGMAELIVSKNRHGATGTVKLVFRKEVTQFVNYTPIQDQTQKINEYENNFR